jgi:hypothetical protein
LLWWAEPLANQLVASDGQAARHSFERALDRGLLHLMRAWATAAHSVLGQMAAEQNSHEITAIPTLLRLLERTSGDAVSYARRSDMSRLALEAQRIAERGRGFGALAKARQGVLEIALREDDSRLRKGHARENVARLRPIAFTLRKQTKTGRHGVKVQRNRAGWDNHS